MKRKYPALIRGKVWRFGDNVDTDQIYPGKYLPLTDKKAMAAHAMEGAERGEVFMKMVRPGDILIAGKNFGCGSSREHAAVAIRGAGISAVIAESFAGIFYRNCVNTALPAIEYRDAKKIRDGDILEVDIGKGEIRNRTTGRAGRTAPVTRLEQAIVSAGGLLAYLKKKPRNRPRRK